MKKKLFALGALSTVGVGLVSGTPTFAADADGTTNIIYQSSTTGPIGPIDPNDPDNDPNNWMVQYPKTITLNEQNKLSNSDDVYDEMNLSQRYKSEYSTKGKKLEFKVTRQVEGVNGGFNVSQGNVGNGILVQATADNQIWKTGEKGITMIENGSASEIKMAIGSNTGSSVDATTNSYTDLIEKDGTVTTLTHNSAKKNGYAVIVGSENEVDGKNYSTTIKFQFTRQQPAQP